MIALYTNQQVRQIEQMAISNEDFSEYPLMEAAGLAAFKLVKQQWSEAKHLIVCAGKGNNAGDGYIVARLAKEAGLKVTVVSAFDPKQLKGAALQAYHACSESNVELVRFSDAVDLTADVLVDALLGSGLKGVVEEPLAAFIRRINEQSCPVIALDIPSGLNADSGCIEGVAVEAQFTLSFIGLKRGFFTKQGPGVCGKTSNDDLGLPSNLFEAVGSSYDLLDWDYVKPLLPKRRCDTHKGDYGHVLVIGGDYGMGGAVRMAAEAALRVGAGLVTVATRPEHVSIVSGNRPELMCHQVAEADELAPLLAAATVVVIGPGLGQSSWAKGLLKEVLKSDIPKLLDADALNILNEMDAHDDQWILTPHPGEAARLLDIGCQNIQQDRFKTIKSMQDHYGGVIALKGAGTLIQGEDSRTYVCRAGNPGMASGGMGDILSGIIGGLLAQRLSLLEATKVGVFIHASAADRAAQEGGERGLLATDVLSHLRHFVNPNRLLM